MATKKSQNASDGIVLGIHLDVGHSSIGWAVTETTTPVLFRGCGTVLFPKDSCLASERRANRRQRRHIRSTRQRIERMKLLLAHLGVLSETELDRPGGAYPWKIAAEVLAHGRTLSWNELWDVLRWYAHNRGYDGNAAWQRSMEAEADDKETRESIENARHLMEEHATTTMAETVCAVMGIEPGGKKCASMKRYKAAKASFPRETVAAELRRILRAHSEILPKIDDALMTALLGSAKDHPDAWKAVPCPTLKLPARYAGGLLFGQLVPRFDNRIIGKCPISGEKLPMKNCPEFLEYRWAMLLANIRVRRPGEEPLSPLSIEERAAITNELRQQGYFTKTTLKKAVKQACGTDDGNLDDMMLTPDADKALDLYPAMHELKSKELEQVWDTLPKTVQRRISRTLNKGASITLNTIRAWLDDPAAFDANLATLAGKAKKKPANPLAKTFKAEFPSGRAPYSRAIMRQAVEEVMNGLDPRMEGGALYKALATQKTLPEDAIDQETNNHLVRNRLRVMRRLVEDIVTEYAGGNKALIGYITVELNREVKELSGKTAKQIAQELGLRLKNHSEAVAYAAKELEIPPHKLGGSFIRKVRIAMDLENTCPYTGKQYDLIQLRERGVDLDHIIPRSKRASDSLDSLVVTFKPINAWKSNMTALEFVRQFGGQQVPGMPNLSIWSENKYRDFVEHLRKKKFAHADDQRRRDNRCKRMLTLFADDSADKGFTPGHLTKTSHLTTLALAVLREYFAEADTAPVIHAIPGRITSEIRMGFNLMGALATVNPLVLNEDETLKTKTEIREISHLHHAVDAITLGLASNLIPYDGTVWAAMLKRNLNPNERAILERTKAFQFDASGKSHLRALPEETRASILRCLAESRVATHLPASKHGAALQATTWRIEGQEGDIVSLSQRSRDEKTGKVSRKKPQGDGTKDSGHLLGINPNGNSKLKAIKGAIIIEKNFGVALDPIPIVIPLHQVWKRIGEIKKKNKGIMPRIIRNGMIIQVEQGRYCGIWKVFSVKNNSTGIALALGQVDGLQKDMVALLSTLLSSGLTLCSNRYTGIPRDVPPSD